jgi:hypothetical protein
MRSAGEGVEEGAMTSNGTPMSLSICVTAVRAFLRRFHFSVGPRVSYGRFERGEEREGEGGVGTVVEDGLSRMECFWQALPAP